MKNRLLTDDDRFLFAQGTWQQAYKRLGAHKAVMDGQEGFAFAVWAPQAKSVRVTGDFCGWDPAAQIMPPADESGVWRLFVAGAKEGDAYKYVIETERGEFIYKADPYAFWAEKPPATASRLYDPFTYRWRDGLWMRRRQLRRHFKAPLNIYEVHLGSWRRNMDGSYLSYEQLADTLIPYAAEMGYTHLELLPVMEHPFDGSWGYQLTGYYAPTARYGSPAQFMAFIEKCHLAGLGVILDWVPGHFCRDAHGLASFTGKMLYERAEHAQWGTFKFDFGRGEVRSFLLSNALFWLQVYHADGLRVDGVTSMLYLNFGVDDPTQQKYSADGSETDAEAVAFLRLLNRNIGTLCPGAITIAEESTAWPLVSRPPDAGGLGFHYKWDMGWMNDTLRYMKTDFPFRPYHHRLLTFSMMYCYNENFILPLSHDEVVHGKCSLIGRMPGDYWRRFAGMRALMLYQMLHPGGKLNFMGSEYAPFIEWRCNESLEWFLPEQYEPHRKHRDFVRALNALYRQEKALWQRSYEPEGFRWIDADNAAQSVLLFERRGDRPCDTVWALISFVPEVWDDYRVGVPAKGVYREIFNSDDAAFGGSGRRNEGPLTAEAIPCHGQPYSVALKTPPIGGLLLKRVRQTPAKAAEKAADTQQSSKRQPAGRKYKDHV